MSEPRDLMKWAQEEYPGITWTNTIAFSGPCVAGSIKYRVRILIRPSRKGGYAIDLDPKWTEIITPWDFEHADNLEDLRRKVTQLIQQINPAALKDTQQSFL